MIQRLAARQASLGVVGLGYVGRPVARAFSAHFEVVGHEIDPERLAQLRSEDLPFALSDDPAALSGCSFYIVAVPTPVDAEKRPDLGPLKKACEVVGAGLSKGDIVVFESTVYPGCTREACVPILEAQSGLKATQDFWFGYSPERINPGDPAHGLESVVKLVSGCCELATQAIAEVYETVVKAGVHRCSSIEVAEAAKVIENTQRDLNIALMNELSMLFEKLGLDTQQVLTAAKTKWNFWPFEPGLVGGHCIGVDPYYLTHKAREVGHEPQVILAGRAVNDQMGSYVAQTLAAKLEALGHTPKDSRALVLGATFKEDVADVRNTRVVDLVQGLQRAGMQVDLTDPLADPRQVEKECHLALTSPSGTYSLIVLAVAHQAYLDQPADWFLQWAAPGALLADLKGRYKGQITELNYWSL